MIDSNKQCVVIFPVYKPLETIERKVLKQAVRMTEGYKAIFVAPEGMKLDESFGTLSNMDVEYFAPHYFNSIIGYNDLMLAKEFYDRFADYEYMLIHQTDAYLFRPDLNYWCNKGYDYVGAPWLRPDKIKKAKIYKFIIKYFPFIYSEQKRKIRANYNSVGNGGLSLRRIETFLSVLSNPKSKGVIDHYRKELTNNSFYNEDVFWGMEAPKLVSSFSKPTWQEALEFSFELDPEWSYKFIGNKLPFGCHAFDVHGTDFWKSYIPSLNEK